MKALKKIFWILLLLLGCSNFSEAKIKIPEASNPPRLVNDYTGTLTDLEQEKLESRLENFVRSSSNRIVVVIVSDLDGAEPVDYATELGRSWKLGTISKENGLVFLISKTEHKIFIAPGNGLQGALPDGVVKLIIEHDVKPFFKTDQFYLGIDSACTDIIKATKGEFKPDAVDENSDDDSRPSTLTIIIIVVVILFIIIGSMFGGGRGGGTYIGRGGYGGFMGPMIFGGGGFGRRW